MAKFKEAIHFRDEKEFGLLERRRKIASMYCRGYSQHEIAKEVKITQGMVSIELKKVREEWLATIVDKYDERKAAEVARIDHMEREAWAAWERSCTPAEVMTKRQDKELRPVIRQGATEKAAVVQESMRTVKEHLQIVTRGQAGNPAFLDRVAWCIETRLKIFGILKEDKGAQQVNLNINWDNLFERSSLPEQDPLDAKIIEVVASQPSQLKPSTNGDHHE